MDFFKRSDFELFSSLRTATYKKDDPDQKILVDQLLGTVYAKTEYWARLLSERGYGCEVSKHWQVSGYFKKYTWAKIYLPDAPHHKVFFTIGVGSRLTAGEHFENTLEYKLDCQRTTSKGLDPSIIYEFDKYIKENCPEAARVAIKVDQLENLNWDKLVACTWSFMSKHLDHYHNLLKLTNLSESNWSRKIIRLCWNNNGWTKPSGPDGKSRASYDAFEKEKGYGYEEWIFNPKFEIEGYRYGFIQAFNKGKHHGKKYEISAYAIQTNRQGSSYYWIGKIRTLEVLQIAEQDAILKEYEERGWLAEMEGHLREVGVEGFDYGPIPENRIVNVRYKVDPNNWIRYDEPIPIVEPKIEIGKNKHYVALPKVSETSIDELPVGAFTFTEGHNPTITGAVRGERKQGIFIMDLKHKLVQESMYRLLSSEYKNTGKRVGTENKTGYGKSVDLVVSCPTEGTTFYEIKTSGSSLQCIREAIGQLFEYSFYTNCQNADKLIVVGLSKAPNPVKSYLRHLRATTRLSLYYQYFNYEKGTLEELS